MKSSNRAKRYRKVHAALEAELGHAPSTTDRFLLSAAAVLSMMQQDQIDAFLNGNEAALESALDIGDALLNNLEILGTREKFRNVINRHESA
jgi:hypothetical protein